MTDETKPDPASPGQADPKTAPPPDPKAPPTTPAGSEPEEPGDEPPTGDKPPAGGKPPAGAEPPGGGGEADEPPADPPKPDPAPAPVERQLDAAMSKLREWTTTIIGVAIAALALWMLGDTYLTAKLKAADIDLAAFERQKDLLLIALGLLGTVTGYYLGRVPAERQADAAREQAVGAKTAQNEAEQRNETLKKDVSEGLDKIVAQETATDGLRGGKSQTMAVVRELRAKL